MIPKWWNADEDFEKSTCTLYSKNKQNKIKSFSGSWERDPKRGINIDNFCNWFSW